MRGVLTIARRELAALFYSPIAYAVIGLFALGAALVFVAGFVPGQEATVRTVFDATVWLLVFLVPAVGMRLLSEEFARGTVERLMTLPVSESQVVAGKWLACVFFLAVMLAALLVPVAVLEFVAEPDYGPVFTGLLGLLLVGAVYAAVAVFASATTQNQVVAFMVAVFINCGLTFVLFFLPRSDVVGPEAQAALHYANLNRQYADFAKGLIDVRHFVYFASGTLFFLYAAVKLLESRRWR